MAGERTYDEVLKERRRRESVSHLLRRFIAQALEGFSSSPEQVTVLAEQRAADREEVEKS
jgi:hypothetical protein